MMRCVYVSLYGRWMADSASLPRELRLRIEAEEIMMRKLAPIVVRSIPTPASEPEVHSILGMYPVP